MKVKGKPAVLKQRLRVLASGLLLAPLAIGCQKESEVSRYSVPRPLSDRPSPSAEARTDAPSPEAKPKPQGRERMLAAIIRRERVWFFKLVGPEALVSEQAGRFREFVGSIRFADEAAAPEWKLPVGWKQQPGSGMRHATIAIDAPGSPLELSVTPLKAMPGDFNDYVMQNVERWRQQLGLPPTSKARLFGPGERSGELSEMKLGDGGKVLTVDLAGDPGTSVANGLAGSSAQPPVGPAPGLSGGQGSGTSPQLTYKAPPGWTPGKADGMRAAAFEVHDGSKQAEITVIALPAGSGDLLGNVNRWRDQVHLGPVSSNDLAGLLKEFLVDGERSLRAELVGPATAQPREGILGVICSRQDKSWFFKMKGDAELVARERDRFEAFVHSVKFEGREGAKHGQ
jgi:hypothetical protein